MRAPGGVERRQWRPRAAVPLLVCVVAGVGLSCEGDCLPGTTGPGPSFLEPRYVLAAYQNQPPPAVISDDGQRRVRLLTDTLLFTPSGTPPPANGTYVEILVLGVRQGTGAEVVTRTVSAPRPFTTGTPSFTIVLTGFTGAGAQGAAVLDLTNPSTGRPGQNANVTGADGRRYVYTGG
jgi:hypothetical protein